MRTKLALLVIAAALIFGTLPAFSQAAVTVIGRKAPIPGGYKTYSLFLICNPEWLDPSKSAGLTNLYQQFQAFGHSIGDDQAAVWFWKKTVTPGWEEKAAPVDVIDVERSINFCKAWKLKPSDGPYIVVTSTRPDEQNLTQGLPENSAVLKLGGMTPSDISSLLAKLTDSLLLSGKVDPSLATPPKKLMTENGSPLGSQETIPASCFKMLSNCGLQVPVAEFEIEMFWLSPIVDHVRISSVESVFVWALHGHTVRRDSKSARAHAPVGILPR